MKESSRFLNDDKSMIHKSFVPGLPVNPVLEKYPKNQNLEDFIEVSEFKKFQIENKKIEKEDEDKIIINSKEDIELLEKLYSFLPEDKKYQIQNYFLDVGDINNKNDNENNNIKIFNHDLKNINEKTIVILNQKKLYNNNFETDNFPNSVFIKNVKSIIIDFFHKKFFLSKNNNNNIINENINLNNNKKQNINNNNNSISNEITNEYIFDQIINTEIPFFFKQKIPNSSQSKNNSISENDSNIISNSDLSEAIYEYENQVMSYMKSNEIDPQITLNFIPEKNEPFDIETYLFFKNLIIKEKNKPLKNKIKLVLRAINYKDPIFHREIFDNKIKNKILKYWKEKYLKEVELETNERKNFIEAEKKSKVYKDLMRYKYNYKSPFRNSNSNNNQRSLRNISYLSSGKLKNAFFNRNKKIEAIFSPKKLKYSDKSFTKLEINKIKKNEKGNKSLINNNNNNNNINFLNINKILRNSGGSISKSKSKSKKDSNSKDTL